MKKRERLEFFKVCGDPESRMLALSPLEESSRGPFTILSLWPSLKRMTWVQAAFSASIYQSAIEQKSESFTDVFKRNGGNQHGLIEQFIITAKYKYEG